MALMALMAPVAMGSLPSSRQQSSIGITGIPVPASTEGWAVHIAGPTTSEFVQSTLDKLTHPDPRDSRSEVK